MSEYGGAAIGGHRVVVMAPETTPGIDSAGPGQMMRRTSADFALVGSAITSDEIRPSNQVANFWLGPRSIKGQIAGDLSAGSCTMLFEGLLRSPFTAGTTLTPLPGATLTQDLGLSILAVPGQDLVAAGFRGGDIVRLNGVGGDASADNAIDFITTTAFATQLNLYNSAVVFAAGASPDIVAVVGAKCFMPATGLQKFTYTIEDQFLDRDVVERFAGCVVDGLTITASASGIATFVATLTGQTMVQAVYPLYGVPAQITTSPPLMACGGVLMLNGERIGYITSFALGIAAETNADANCASNTLDTILQGRLRVTGSLSILMISNDQMVSDMLAENTFQISLLLTDSTSPGADFISIFLPVVKLLTGNTSDSATAIVQTFTFQALEQTTDPTLDGSTIVIQDSLGPSTMAAPAGGWVFGVSGFGTGAF